VDFEDPMFVRGGTWRRELHMTEGRWAGHSLLPEVVVAFVLELLVQV
jgi:hypothetical protein